MTAALRDVPLFDDLQPPVAVDAAPVLGPEEDWKISVRLTLREIQAVASGQLPASLVAYCRDGLKHWEGSPELAACEARAHAQQVAR